MSEIFHILPENPNVQSDGCLCHPAQGGTDTAGPFVVFYSACTDEGRAPHAVVCAGCITAAGKQLEAAPKPVKRKT